MLFGFDSKFRDAGDSHSRYSGVGTRNRNMNYRIRGLQRDLFAAYFDMDDVALAEHGALRVTAGASKGWPCRITLEDAKAGEQLILLNHVSHDVATPYRSTYAIYVRENAEVPADYVDETPPVFEGRPMAFRAFDADGMLRDAALALPGQADAKIRGLFDNADIAYIHAHNAAHGCFAATVERA
jgi:Protein of unknown function (DUF1203)